MTPPGSAIEDKPAKEKKIKSKTKTKSRQKQLLMIRCPICFNHLAKGSASSTRCGHVFCTSCLQKALIMKSECPTCRRKLFGARGFHRLYLNSNVCEEYGDNQNTL